MRRWMSNSSSRVRGRDTRTTHPWIAECAASGEKCNPHLAPQRVLGFLHVAEEVAEMHDARGVHLDELHAAPIATETREGYLTPDLRMHQPRTTVKRLRPAHAEDHHPRGTAARTRPAGSGTPYHPRAGPGRAARAPSGSAPRAGVGKLEPPSSRSHARAATRPRAAAARWPWRPAAPGASRGKSIRRPMRQTRPASDAGTLGVSNVSVLRLEETARARVRPAADRSRVGATLIGRPWRCSRPRARPAARESARGTFT